MDTIPLLTPEEISIINNAQSRLADCLIELVRSNAGDADFFQDQEELIIKATRQWWIEQRWEWFLGIMQTETKFLKRDPVLNEDLTKLLDTQKQALSKARDYYEMAKDQYYEADESFYYQMGLNSYEEIWKMFTQAKNLAPTNVEIRYHFIGMMRQAEGHISGRLLKEIQELLQIPLINATTFEKTNPEKFYRHPQELLKEYQKTAKPIEQDSTARGLREIADRLQKNSNRDSTMNSVITAMNDMAGFLENANYLEYYEEGNKLYNLGKFEDALLTLQKTIAISPNFAEAHYLLGKIYSILSLLSNAVTEFAKTVELQPETAKYHYSLGEAYLLQNNYQQALFEFENTLKLNPFFEEAQNRISEIKSK